MWAKLLADVWPPGCEETIGWGLLSSHDWKSCSVPGSSILGGKGRPTLEAEEHRQELKGQQGAGSWPPTRALSRADSSWPEPVWARESSELRPWASTSRHLQLRGVAAAAVMLVSRCLCQRPGDGETTHLTEPLWASEQAADVRPVGRLPPSKHSVVHPPEFWFCPCSSSPGWIRTFHFRKGYWWPVITSASRSPWVPATAWSSLPSPDDVWPPSTPCLWPHRCLFLAKVFIYALFIGHI